MASVGQLVVLIACLGTALGASSAATSTTTTTRKAAPTTPPMNYPSCNATVLGAHGSPFLKCIQKMLIPEYFLQLVSASSLVVNSIGSYEACDISFSTKANTTLCVIDTYEEYPGYSPLLLTQGICVPDICSTDDVFQFWNCMRYGNFVNLVNLAAHDLCLIPTNNCSKITKYAGALIAFATGVHASFKGAVTVPSGAHCGDGADTEWTTGGILMLMVCSFICIMVILAEILDRRGINNNTSEGQVLLNPSDSQRGVPQPEAINTVNSDEQPIRKKRTERSSLGRAFIRAFSIRNNIDGLFKKEASRSLGCLDGMRALSMLWIILGHTGNFQIPGFLGYDNEESYFALMERFTFQGAFAANNCVDTFFFLSGMLTFYVLVRKFQKTHRANPMLLVIALRFLRLVPLIAFVMCFYGFVVGHFSSGPFWYRMTAEYERCQTVSWANVLFVNNFYPEVYADQCMPWTWYLANDMQFFILGIFLFNLCYTRWPRLAALLTLVLAIVTTAITGYITSTRDLSIPSPGAQDRTYDKPYTRAAPFLIGILTTIIYIDVFKTQSPFKGRRNLTNSLLFLAIAGLVVIIYIPYSYWHDNWTNAQNTLYAMVSRPCWTICLSIITLVCICGDGGTINWFLTLPAWEPLGKLTFAAYLCHPIIIRVTYYSLYNTIHYTDIEYAVYYVGFACLAYATAFVLFITVEQPAAILVGLLVPK